MESSSAAPGPREVRMPQRMRISASSPQLERLSAGPAGLTSPDHLQFALTSQAMAGSCSPGVQLFDGSQRHHARASTNEAATTDARAHAQGLLAAPGRQIACAADFPGVTGAPASRQDRQHSNEIRRVRQWINLPSRCARRRPGDSHRLNLVIGVLSLHNAVRSRSLATRLTHLRNERQSVAGVVML